MPKPSTVFFGVDFAEIETRVLALTRGAGKSEFDRRNWNTFRINRRKPMFTKQHYEATAMMLRIRRTELQAAVTVAGKHDPDALIRLNELNEVVVRFAKLFTKDNKKFKDLLFIGACDAGTTSNARQE